MKKPFLFLLSLVMLACSAASFAAAEDLTGRTIASGTVAAAAFEDLTAPWSGTLMPFDLEAGDTVSAGDVLFTMRTQDIFAPEDGTVTEVFAREGDDAAAVLARYGALASLQGSPKLLINATNANVSEAKWKDIRVGQAVYFKTDSVKGSGRIVMIAGNSFVVEVTEGAFDIGRRLTLYENSGYKNQIGTGTVVLRDPVSVTGLGRVVAVHAEAGTEVTAGQRLFTVAGQDADPGSGPAVAAPSGGVVAQVAVAPGQQVWKGALLARVWRTDALEVVAEVDEMDLPRLKVGDTCPIVLDMDPDTVLTGTVTEISGLGVTRQNAAYYRVRFALEEKDLPLGASASVYLPGK